jgi:glycerol uptake facilitator protein
VLGAFVGAALVFAVYNEAINRFDATHHVVEGTAASVATYSTFATFPRPISTAGSVRSWTRWSARRSSPCSSSH